MVNVSRIDLDIFCFYEDLIKSSNNAFDLPLKFPLFQYRHRSTHLQTDERTHGRALTSGQTDRQIDLDGFLNGLTNI